MIALYFTLVFLFHTEDPIASAHLFCTLFILPAVLLFFFWFQWSFIFSSLFSTCDLYLIFDLTRDVRRATGNWFSSALLAPSPEFRFLFSLVFVCFFFFSVLSRKSSPRMCNLAGSRTRGFFAHWKRWERERIDYMLLAIFWGTGGGQSGGFWANCLTVYSNCKSSKLKMRDWKPKIGHLPASYPNSPILNR